MWTLTNTHTPPIHIAVFVNSAMHVLSFIYWIHTQRHQCSVLFLSSQRLKSIWNIYIFFKSVFNQKINNISIFPKCAFILSISFTLFLFHFVWNIEMRASNRSFELIVWFRQCFYFSNFKTLLTSTCEVCTVMNVCMRYFFFLLVSFRRTNNVAIFWSIWHNFSAENTISFDRWSIYSNANCMQKKNTDLENNMHTHTRTLDDLFLCLFQFFIRFCWCFVFRFPQSFCVFHLSSFHSRYHLCEFIL